uniref:Uncharacterized protein n=1 Tax=Plectus sambesii TaxID=2011161 RepID=A0A914UUK3_9BILA
MRLRSSRTKLPAAAYCVQPTEPPAQASVFTSRLLVGRCRRLPGFHASSLCVTTTTTICGVLALARAYFVPPRLVAAQSHRRSLRSLTPKAAVELWAWEREDAQRRSCCY